jgi:hypothetical protein
MFLFLNQLKVNLNCFGRGERPKGLAESNDLLRNRVAVRPDIFYIFALFSG